MPGTVAPKVRGWASDCRRVNSWVDAPVVGQYHTLPMHQRFRLAAEKLVEHVAREGYVMRPYVDASLPVFQTLAPLEAASALSRLETMLETYELVHARGLQLDDSQALLDAYLEVSGTTTEPDVREQIQDDQTVEVYSANQKLILCSLRSLRAVSYTIEDLICRLWSDVLSRDIMGITEALTKVAIDILTEQVDRIIYTGSIPDHVCREVNSEEKRSMIIFHHFFAPLRKSGRVMGFICVNNIYPYNESSED